MTPIEVFGGAEFPPITDDGYGITLAGHGFYWFALQSARSRGETIAVAGDRVIPVISVRSLDSIADDDRTVGAITRLLRQFLPSRRWFRSKARRIRTVTLEDVVPVPDVDASLSFIRVEFIDGEPEDYVLPVALARGEAVAGAEEQFRDTVLARLQAPDGSQAVLYGALWKPEFSDALLNAIARRKRLHGGSGEVIGIHTKAFRRVWGGRRPNLRSKGIERRAEQQFDHLRGSFHSQALPKGRAWALIRTLRLVTFLRRVDLPTRRL